MNLGNGILLFGEMWSPSSKDDSMGASICREFYYCDAIVNKIVFLISFLGCSLLMYKNTIDS